MEPGRRLRPYFKDYESYHRAYGNKVCHFIGIPSITVTLLGLLAGWVIWTPVGSEIWRLDGGMLLWLGATLWYLILDWRIAIPFSLFGLGGYFLGRAMPTPLLWGVFASGWIVQYVGHLYYEKNRPAFYKNFLHVLIGPLWIFSVAVGYYRLHKPKP